MRNIVKKIRGTYQELRKWTWMFGQMSWDEMLLEQSTVDLVIRVDTPENGYIVFVQCIKYV